MAPATRAQRTQQEQTPVNKRTRRKSPATTPSRRTTRAKTPTKDDAVAPLVRNTPQTRSMSARRHETQRQEQNLRRLSDSLGTESATKRKKLDQSEIQNEQEEEQKETNDKSPLEQKESAGSRSSRQLEFEDEENANEKETNEEEETAAVNPSPSRTLRKCTSKTQQEDDDSLFEISSDSDAPPANRRRETVRWTPKEVEFLRQGVEKYGIGKWKRILIDGRNVFLKHRTNVDLKDKWRVLSQGGKTKSVSVPLEITASVERRRKTTTSKTQPPVEIKIKRPMMEENEQDDYDMGIGEDPTTPQTKRIKQEVSTALVNSHVFTIEVMTNESYPESIDVEIDASKIPQIRKLRKRLHREFFAHDTRDFHNMQMILLPTRRLLADDDLTAPCFPASSNHPVYLLLTE